MAMSFTCKNCKKNMQVTPLQYEQFPFCNSCYHVRLKEFIQSFDVTEVEVDNIDMKNRVGKHLQELAKKKTLESDSMFDRKKTLEIGRMNEVELKAWEMASEFKFYCQKHNLSPDMLVDGVAWNAASVIRIAEMEATNREWQRVKLIIEEAFGL